MTNNYHTPIPSTPRQPANAATVNAPLAELDAELTAQDARVTQLETDIPVLSGVEEEFYNGLGEFSVPAGTGSTNGHVIQGEGVDLPQRAKLNFLGTGVDVSDDVGGTKVTITAGAPETTAENDIQVGNGAGAWVKKTLAEFLTIIGKGAANGLASLNAGSKVVQDPANATAVPTANKIPIADAEGKLDSWIGSAHPNTGSVMLSDKLLAATATQFDFTGIPATYKDLQIELYIRSSKAAATSDPVYWEINGDTNGNYDVLSKQGYHSATMFTFEVFGAIPGATNQWLAFATAAGSPAGYFAKYTIRLPNYAQAVGNKIIEARGVAPLNNTTGNLRIFDAGGVWKSPAAINRVRFFLGADSYIIGSRATLYGIY